MAWDRELPANNTKIRYYPTVLQDNFSAIEQGGDSLQLWKINMIQRNAIPSAPVVTPARVDNTMQMYSKQNADGLTDLYVLDDRGTANDIELTENGKIGGRSQDFVMNNFYFGTDAVSYGQWAVPSVVGAINSSGGVMTGSVGIDSTSVLTSSPSRGRRITFTSGYITNTNYFVVLTPILSSGSTGYVMFTTNKTATTVDVYYQIITGTTANIQFDIAIFGGR